MRGVQVGAQARTGVERLSRKGPAPELLAGERLERPPMRGANGDFTDAALALQVIQRRQKLIVGDHAAADHSDGRRRHIAGISSRNSARAVMAAASDSRRTCRPSSTAASVTTSGGAIFTVAP